MLTCNSKSEWVQDIICLIDLFNEGGREVNHSPTLALPLDYTPLLNGHKPARCSLVIPKANGFKTSSV